MGKTFKNHKEFLEFKEKEKRNSNFAERLVIRVEKELLDECINEQNVLNEAGRLL